MLHFPDKCIETYCSSTEPQNLVRQNVIFAFARLPAGVSLNGTCLYIRYRDRTRPASLAVQTARSVDSTTEVRFETTWVNQIVSN